MILLALDVNDNDPVLNTIVNIIGISHNNV